MTEPGRSLAYWSRTQQPSEFPPLGRDLSVDVVVIGGGLAGASTAYLMKAAGLSVALLERDRCASGDTSETTAHLTMVVDEPLTTLVNDFGRDTATAVWDAGRVAIDRIERNVAAEGIECGFRRVPGFMHTSLAGSGLSADVIRENANLAADLGFAATFVAQTPGVGLPGMRVENQALFHPLAYVAALLRAVEGEGSYVFEHSEASEVSDGPLRVVANGRTVTCEHVVITTHSPLLGKSSVLSAAFLDSKLMRYTSYALGGHIPSGAVPHGLYWDTHDPYHYLRVHGADDRDYAIFGGADHKTGQEADTLRQWEELENTLRRHLPFIEVTDRWSGQVIETNDGLPYIGETSERQYVATGFSGNGMTYGTLAAMMMRDAVLGRRNPWRELFDPRRTSIRAGAWDYITENKDYLLYMVRDRLFASHRSSVSVVRPGHGEVLTLDGERVAAYRDPQGVLHLRSAVCTHMACEVHFNAAETSWDCPCHGSRFRVDGSVIAGPAETPLAPVGE